MKNEFSYPLLADDITKKAETFKLEMSEEEAAAVAKRLDVKGVNMHEMSCTVQRMDDGCTIYAHGYLKGEVTQPCVVTLEDVVQEVSEEFEAFYLDESQVKSFDMAKRSQSGSKAEDDFEGMMKERRMPEEHEEPEIITKGKIDLGELIVQHLSLGVDPYPHTVEAMETQGEVVHEDPKESPFAVLKDHLHKKK